MRSGAQGRCRCARNTCRWPPAFCRRTPARCGRRCGPDRAAQQRGVGRSACRRAPAAPDTAALMRGGQQPEAVTARAGDRMRLRESASDSSSRRRSGRTQSTMGVMSRASCAHGRQRIRAIQQLLASFERTAIVVVTATGTAVSLLRSTVSISRAVLAAGSGSARRQRAPAAVRRGAPAGILGTGRSDGARRCVPREPAGFHSTQR